MQKCNLCLHCGAAEVPRKALAAVPTPAPTETWRPIPHEEYVRQVEWELPRYGLDVVNAAYALTHDGGRFFGLLQVTRNGLENSEHSLVVGLRNSHDKTLTAGLVAGSQVFVCDNLAFSGEVSVSRKHTSFITMDLPGLIGNAVGRLLGLFQTQDQRVARYRATQLSDAAAHDLTVQALDARVICASKIPRVLKEWREPIHEAFRPRTTWSWFNAVTEALKGGGLHTLPRHTRSLYGICDAYAGVAV